ASSTSLQRSASGDASAFSETIVMAQPARLTSDLLARKGHALPTGGFAHAKLDLIPPQPTIAKPERQPQAPPSRRRRSTTALQEPGRTRQPASDDRVAFTLRLDPERHARLRILAARGGCSGQEMLLKALDAYLEACAADCPCLRTAKAAKPGIEPAKV
ncbi:MAG TPA: hypothetical protein VE597_00820, partial [Geminicoccaceae bacterium]|nr:hypothetical protein [Geminicoccaceae bacterium]